MEHLIGTTILDVIGLVVGSEDVVIHTTTGSLHLYYEHDCCASCTIEDVTGDAADLIGGVVAVAEERIDGNAIPEGREEPSYGSETWTFYEIRTSRGDVTIRWFGESNGYYSESVTVEWLPA